MPCLSRGEKVLHPLLSVGQIRGGGGTLKEVNALVERYSAFCAPPPSAGNGMVASFSTG